MDHGLWSIDYLCSMRILITGANGFLGHYLVEKLLQKKITVIATGKGDCRLPFTTDSNFMYVSMDFTDPYEVHDVFEKHSPDIIIHAGAMSKPDECEENQWQAYVVNVESTLTLLANAEERKNFFIFISTDFVFSGEGESYAEEDERGPVNFYGRTKLDAEDAVMEYEHDWAIVRTVLVYGKNHAGRDNIITVVKKKLEDKEVYRVFDDQSRTPTYVEDLAAGIVSIVEKRATGIYHISGKDVLTPYQMAKATAAFLGLDEQLIERVTAADFSQPAKRPRKTIFNIQKAKIVLGYEPLSFEEGLKRTLS